MGASPVELLRKGDPRTPQEPPVAVQALPPLIVVSLPRSTQLVSQFDGFIVGSGRPGGSKLLVEWSGGEEVDDYIFYHSPKGGYCQRP